MIEASAISFRLGNPDARLFPLDQIRKSILCILDVEAATALQYGEPKGNFALREEIASWVKQEQGVESSKEQVLITNGSMQVPSLLVQALLSNSQLAVIVENPTYFRTLKALRTLSVDIHGCEMTERGIDLNEVEEHLRYQRSKSHGTSALYVIPDGQNPTGIEMKLDIRKSLLDLAYKYDATILEDCAYRYISYNDSVLPTIYSLDVSKTHVIQMATLSKILSPGLRIGWAIGNRETIEKMTNHKFDGGTNPFTSSIGLSILKDKTFLWEHINAIRSHYKAGRDRMNIALSMHCSNCLTWTVPEGGFFFWVKTNWLIEEADLKYELEKAQVSVMYGSECCPTALDKYYGFRIGFTGLSDVQIDDGCGRIAQAIQRIHQQN